MKLLLVALIVTGFPLLAAVSQDQALKYVPGAKVLRDDGYEFKLQTPKGTVVEVELNRDGSLDEASGKSIAAGDVFIPGEGRISLADALSALKKEGKVPRGEWSFEKSMLKGWVYEVEGMEDGKEMEYKIDAKTGKLVKASREIL